MKCKNYDILCNNNARKDSCVQWYYCNKCLQHIAHIEIKKRPELFKGKYNI